MAGRVAMAGTGPVMQISSQKEQAPCPGTLPPQVEAPDPEPLGCPSPGAACGQRGDLPAAFSICSSAVWKLPALRPAPWGGGLRWVFRGARSHRLPVSLDEASAPPGRECTPPTPVLSTPHSPRAQGRHLCKPRARGWAASRFEPAPPWIGASLSICRSLSFPISGRGGVKTWRLRC